MLDTIVEVLALSCSHRCQVLHNGRTRPCRVSETMWILSSAWTYANSIRTVMMACHATESKLATLSQEYVPAPTKWIVKTVPSVMVSSFVILKPINVQVEHFKARMYATTESHVTESKHVMKDRKHALEVSGFATRPLRPSIQEMERVLQDLVSFSTSRRKTMPMWK